MTRFAARHFDGRSSRGTPVELELVSGGTLRVHGLGEPLELPVERVTASARLGSTPRLLRLPAGGSLELVDSDALATALESSGVRHEHGRRLFALERRWAASLGALAASIAVLGFGVRDGVPALAHFVARSLPPDVERSMGEHTLEALDRGLLHESSLPDERRAELVRRFEALRAVNGAPPAQLFFRAAPRLGANALALPAGHVVVTDELVRLAESDDDTVAVLAHELGHVAHQHTLRSLLQNVGVGVLVAGLLGDLTSISAASGALPVTLVELQYGRSFETEADAAGARYLDAAGIPRERLAAMLERLAASRGGESEWAAYLSTHPATVERVAALRAPPR